MDQATASDQPGARFFEPILTHQEILKIADVTNAMLQTWIARGFIKLSAQKPGTGNRRRYTGIEAVRVVMLNNLVLQGVSVSHAAVIVNGYSTEQQIRLNATWLMPDTRAQLEEEREESRASGRGPRADRRRDLLIYRRRPERPGITFIGSPGTVRPFQAIGVNYEDFSRGFYMPDIDPPNDPNYDKARFESRWGQNIAGLFQGPFIGVPVRNIVEIILDIIFTDETAAPQA